MLKKILGILSAVFLVLFIGVLIASSSGGALPPPGGPPPGPPPPAPAPTKGRPTLPGGFYPYSGYHYSGYVRAIDYQNKTFLYDIDGQIVSVKTDDEDIFFRIEERHGREQSCSFEDLKLNQLVWLKGVQKRPGWVVLKIQLSDWIKQK